MSQWEASTRATYPNEIRKVREILEAKRHSPNPLMEYGQLWDQVPTLARKRSVTSNVLGCVSKDSDAEGRGMLTVLVVNKSDGVPSPGFFEMAKTLGRKGDHMKILIQELVKVIQS